MVLTIEDLCTRLPRGTIARIMAAEGPVLKKCADHRIGYFIIRNVTHGGLARAGIRLARLAHLLEGRNPVEVSLFVLRYFFEPFLEEATVTDEEAHFFLTRCPYGWSTRDHLALCDAVMQLERDLVSGIGASLVIHETIPEGAPKCRFTIRRCGGLGALRVKSACRAGECGRARGYGFEG